MAQVKADGTFSLKVRPGRYALEGSARGGWFFKGALLDGVTIGDGPLVVGTDPIERLEAVLRRTRTSLHGTVTGVDGRSASDATIAIFPADRRRWFRLKDGASRVRLLDLDDSQFDVEGLLDDDYFVSAVDDSLMTDWPSQATLERLIPLSTRITLIAGRPASIGLVKRPGR